MRTIKRFSGLLALVVLSGLAGSLLTVRLGAQKAAAACTPLPTTPYNAVTDCNANAFTTATQRAAVKQIGTDVNALRGDVNSLQTTTLLRVYNDTNVQVNFPPGSIGPIVVRDYGQVLPSMRQIELAVIGVQDGLPPLVAWPWGPAVYSSGSASLPA